jgi:beta propeller repeat protein
MYRFYYGTYGGSNMKNKVLFFVLTLTCLFGLISVASSTQIIKIGDGRDPVISGSKVTWADLSGVIHLYDVSTKKDTKISSSAASHPDIYGNKMVWFDKGSGVPRITIYDIPSGAKTFVTKDVDDRSYPHIYGTRIVWSANGNVYLRDISTSIQTKIGSGDSPDIYDTKVVYYTYTEVDDNIAIRMYDVSTKKTVTVNSYGDPNTPHIWGTKVIWSDTYNHQGYIAMYDTSTKKTIDVTHQLDTDPYGNEYGASTGTHISIQGDKIVYNKCVDDYEGKPGVYVYSIPSGKSTLLNEYPENTYTTPEVYGNTIVWGIDNGYGQGTTDNGIYIYTLPIKPVAEFTADKTSGKKPLTVAFKYTGTGAPDTYFWDFGDGINSKHKVTATHTFTKTGSFTVKLTVTNSAGSSTSTKSKYIAVK